MKPKPYTMHPKLREFLGYLSLGVIFIALAFFCMDIIKFIMEWLFYIIGIILILGALGSLSEFLNSPKHPKKEQQ